MRAWDLGNSAVIGLLAGLVLSPAGCSRSDRPALAKASGIVTLDGAVVAYAQVSFVPVSGGRPATGETDEDGRFTMSSYSPGDGAPVGEHYVSVMKLGSDGSLTPEQEAAIRENELAVPEFEVAAESSSGVETARQVEYLIPKRYRDPKSSGLKVTVPSGGSDQLNLELKKQ